MKTYLCSDLHLGSPNSDVPKIMQFFELVSTEARKESIDLILLGDIYDEWLMPFEEIVTTEPYKQAHEALLELSKMISVILVWGNHDYNVGKKLKGTDILVTDEFTYEGIHFSHGWRMDLEQRFAYPYWRFITDLFPYIYQRFFKSPAQIVDDPIPYGDCCKEYHDVCRKVIEKKGYEYLIVGHSHDPLTDGKLIDLGDFVLHSSYAVIQEGKPKLMQL